MQRLFLVAAACGSLVFLAACVIEEDRGGYGHEGYRYNQPRVYIDRDDDHDRHDRDWNDHRGHGGHD